MSDNEDSNSDIYSTDSGSDSEYETSKVNVRNTKFSHNNANKFGKYVEDDEEVIDDSEIDDADEDENDDENEDDDDASIQDTDDDQDDADDEQIGGVDDNPEQDEQDEDDEDDINIGEDGEVIEKVNKPVNVKQKKTTPLILPDYDDDDDDDYEENYLQKFDNDLNNNYIYEFHPECLNHNSDEVSKLSRVIRDENNIIIDPLHKTLPYLTKYEKARILGQRAKQIETGAKPLVKVPDNIIDSYIIAELEFREKKIPFIIKRPIPGGAFEYWRLSDLEDINF